MFAKVPDERRMVGVFLALTFLLYLPVLQAGFVYDDHAYVRENPGIRALDPVAIFSQPERGAAPASNLAKDAYRPGVTLSYAVDYRLWGLSARGFHMENLILALINAGLVWLFLKRVLEPTAARLLALAVFLWHPAQVQAIAWISQRSTLLASAGMLVTLLMLMPPGPWSWKRLSLGWMAFGAALFCRETTGGVALALLLLDFFQHLKTKKFPADRLKFFARYIGLSVLVGLYVTVRTLMLPHWSEFSGPRQWASDAALGLMAFAVYLGKLVLPIKLRLHYAYPAADLWPILGAAAVFLVYVGVVVWGLWRRKRWAMPLAWIFVFLIPVLQFIPIRAFAAERYLYFSLIGFGWGIGLVYKQWPRLRPVLWGGVVVFAVLTFRQVPLWRSEESLWKAAVEADPRDAFAHVAYAGWVKDPQIAEFHLRRALQENPPLPMRVGALTNLSWLALQRQEWRKAEAWAKEALKLSPDDPHARVNFTQARRSPGKRK